MSVFDELEKQLGTKKPSVQGDVFSDLESKLGIPKKEKPKVDWGGVAIDTALKFVGLKRKPQEVLQPQRDVNKYLQAKGIPYTEISQYKGGGIPLKDVEAGKHEEFKKKLQLKGIYPESKWKDVFDRLRSDAVNLLHNSKQYFLDNIPREVLKDNPMPEKGSIDDTPQQRKNIQNVNRIQTKIKDIFKEKSDTVEKQYQDWVKANPNLKPREEWNMPVTEILKRDPSAWKDPALWGYMASGSAVYTIGVIGTASVTTALTGNPLLGLGTGVAVTTPSLSRDLYNDLIENGATPEQANSLSLGIGPLIATVEVVGDLPVLASFSAPFKKLLFGNIRKEVAKRTLASLFGKGLTRFTTIEISETLEEVVQLAIQNATVRTVNENRQVFEGVSDTIIQTLMATAPIAIFGAGAEMKGIGVKTDTQIKEKPITEKPITAPVIPETKQKVFDDLSQKIQKKEVAPTIVPEITEGVAKTITPEKGVIPKSVAIQMIPENLEHIINKERVLSKSINVLKENNIEIDQIVLENRIDEIVSALKEIKGKQARAEYFVSAIENSAFESIQTEFKPAKLEKAEDVIPKELEPLAQEAKKYKSVEELMKKESIFLDAGTRNQYYANTPYREQIDIIKEKLNKKQPLTSADNKIIEKNRIWELEQVLKDKPAYLNEGLSNKFLKDFANKNNLVFSNDIVAKNQQALDRVIEARKNTTKDKGRSLGLALGYEDIGVMTKFQFQDFYNQATQPVKEVVKPEVKEKPKGKPTKVAESIKAKAEEKGITEQFKGLAEYEPVVIKEQTRKIEKLMSEDIEKAKRMATGQEPLSDGIKGAMLIKMIEDYAMENRDGDLILALANSPLVSETSEAGQTLRLIRERSPDSATARIQEVKKIREEVAEKKQKGKTKTEIKSDMKKDLKKNIEKQNKKVNKYAWSNFIDKITC